MMSVLQRLLMSIGLCISLAVHAYGWKVDCTKFVFAPKCRGVAAKRNSDFLSAGDMVQHIPTSLLSRLSELQHQPSPQLTHPDSSSSNLKPQAFRLDFTLTQPHRTDPKASSSAALGRYVDGGDWVRAAETEVEDYGAAYPEVNSLKVKAYLEALAAGGLLTEGNQDYSLDLDRT